MTAAESSEPGALLHTPVTLADKNRTKIVATLGPASTSPQVMEKLLLAGVAVFRLNFSHGSHEEHAANIANIRQVSARLDTHVAILGDLQGPKFRTGMLENDMPVELENGQTVRFTAQQQITGVAADGVTVIGCNYPQLVEAVKPGDTVLMADGTIRLTVLNKPESLLAECRVVDGGPLGSRKGINLPDSHIQVPALTEKDLADALFGVKAGVDYLALSFVQQADDVVALRKYVTEAGLTCPPIIAKIERPHAVEHIPEILEVSDGLMVARGDLGVELPPERVPIIQKQLVEIANHYGIPVIIATQMLESMVDSLQPARSDVSDIANAVLDRADALMLSGETAMGEYPVECVTMMRKIIQEVEASHLAKRYRPHESSAMISPHDQHTIAHAASYAATKSNVNALVVLSNSGSMARRISKLKPYRAMIAVTPHHAVANKMCLLWGVTPVESPITGSSDETMEMAENLILEKGLLQHGDRIVFCAGKTPLKWLADVVKIYRIGDVDHTQDLG